MEKPKCTYWLLQDVAHCLTWTAVVLLVVAVLSGCAPRTIEVYTGCKNEIVVIECGTTATWRW